MLEKIEGKRRRGWQRMSWLDSITDSMDMNHSKFREIVKNRQAWLTTDHRIAEIQPWLSDWTTATQTPDATFFSIFSHGWFLRWGFQPFWWIIQLSCVSPVCVCACYVISVMANSLEPCSVACQASLSMGFSRQEYWSGSPFPFPEDLLKPGSKLRFLALQADSLPSELPGKNWIKVEVLQRTTWFYPDP